jgi:hypothetical protein
MTKTVARVAPENHSHQWCHGRLFYGAIRRVGAYMPRIKDIAGNTYGRLTVIRLDHVDQHARWLCRCECGAECVVRSNALKSGKTTSCGCYVRQIHTKHSMCNSPEYKSWVAMKCRCSNKNSKNYMHYGGRGISICDRWVDSFENFYTDMGERPEGTSLDRGDVNGDYTPENCRWATSREQVTNRNKSLRFMFRGAIRPLIEIAEMADVKYRTLYDKIKSGLDIEVCVAAAYAARKDLRHAS